MAHNPEANSKKAASDDVLALMESPLYWTMKVKERLALLQHAPNGGEDEGLREKILTWIKTGVF